MRKFILGIVIVTATVTSCLKSKEPENICETFDPCAIKAPQSEVTEVEKYLTDSSITGALKHCSGMYYKTGVVFDSTKAGSPATFIPVNLITGWQDGIPLIKKGGSIQLFIPSTLAYGAGQPMMIFNIELLDVKP